jgi:diadenosine tetraphosphatase ApaH/serine/threonine PP2A family protein phosphatase
MRYGIISDIHGNLEALSAALERIGEVDAFICPGDVVGYGADANECCDILRKLAPTIVLGNHDAAVIGSVDLSYFNPNARAAAIWTSGILSEANREFLSQLQPVLYERDWVVAHGSLDDPFRFKYIVSPWTAAPSFEKMPDGVLFCFVGHTHVAEYYAKMRGVNGVDQIPLTNGGRINLREGFSYVVNCGSIGQPRDGNPHAGCGIFDTEERIVEVFRVPYDIAGAQRKIMDAGLPRSLAERLSLGV